MIESSPQPHEWARPDKSGRRRPQRNLQPLPYLSVVVPIFNEQENVTLLHQRLSAALQALGKSYEIIYVDDGSRDESLELLKDIAAQDAHVKVVELTRNYGQHAAILAGFEQTQGEIVVTLDADLQNPPEEIGKLIAAMEEGHDVVGSVRVDRQDAFARKLPSRMINRIIARSTGVQLTDYGCMLRAYRRAVVDNVCRYGETATFIPALANLFAHSVTEVPVEHAERAAGKSKYNWKRLIALAFDLMTGFSLFPIQMVSFMGGLISALGIGFGVFLFIRRLVVGPEAEGVFTLFAILFVFVGLQILALGLIGEYIGRIYFEVRRRPRYLVRNVYERDA
jgi:undecaprenyl-phosphate 4-deoxy-4-formamido-L-arabinose transferase